MNGLEKINERIRQDARAEMDAILSDAGKRAEISQKGYADQARQLTDDAARRRQEACAERLERLRSSADMERRQLLLGVKQECIDAVFDRAAELLCQLPREDYIALLARTARQNGDGTEEIILSAADRDAIGSAVVAAANADGASFTLSAETREMGGGLILKRGLVETNCSFRTQLHALRQTQASDVARILFD
ncbi:MAG: V-type ATP synthase subunit E [Oscillospiraceae bacterium]|nr:V-type ATP synthase subunit E [Oscillospiraceae bacterium]